MRDDGFGLAIYEINLQLRCHQVALLLNHLEDLLRNTRRDVGVVHIRGDYLVHQRFDQWMQSSIRVDVVMHHRIC